jgi:putative transposase
MPRPNRILFQGGLYHVCNRGTEPLFRDDADRLHWITLLREIKEDSGIKILAYGLRPQHYHLVLQTPDANLDKVMETLNRSYSRHFNEKYQRRGRLYQGPYRAKLVQKDKYLLPLLQYVHLNPEWSSHAYYLGQKADMLVDTASVLAAFNPDLEQARSHYQAFMLLPLDKKEFKRLDSFRNGVLGDLSLILPALPATSFTAPDEVRAAAPHN